jgi:hypothetical protein
MKRRNFFKSSVAAVAGAVAPAAKEATRRIMYIKIPDGVNPQEVMRRVVQAFKP